MTKLYRATDSARARLVLASPGQSLVRPPRQAIKTSPVWREAEALRCETLEQPAVDEDAVIDRFEKVT